MSFLLIVSLTLLPDSCLGFRFRCTFAGVDRFAPACVQANSQPLGFKSFIMVSVVYGLSFALPLLALLRVI